MVKLQDYQILVNMMRRKMTVKSSLLEGLNISVCYHSYCSVNNGYYGDVYSGQYITGPPRQAEGDVSGDELVKNVFTAAKR